MAGTLNGLQDHRVTDELRRILNTSSEIPIALQVKNEDAKELAHTAIGVWDL